MLDRHVLEDCLAVIGVISHTEITEMISEIYYENLKDLPSDRIEAAFKSIVIDGKFPKIGQIRELATGITADADWHTIMAVASGTIKSATISGISAAALLKAVTNAGLPDRYENYSPQNVVDKVTIALKKISFCDDPYTLREIRKDWAKLVSVPHLDNALPPADVEITLVDRELPINLEHPVDVGFVHRTASMLRCIAAKGYCSPAWIEDIDKFPAARKREIMEAIEINNWTTPALKETKLYRKYQSTAKAMRQIDEAAINEAIADSRKTCA